MTNDDRVEFAKCMMVLNEMCDRDVSNELMDIYFLALKEYSVVQVQDATNQLVRTWRYPNLPKPVDFIELIDGSKKDQASIAYQTAIQAIAKHGTYVSMEFEDKKIHSAIQAIGGLIELGNCTNKNLVWKQKEFERAYNLNTGEPPKHLIGRHELSNHGFNKEPEILKISTTDVKQLTEGNKDGESSI
jgi:hypothetical protein